MPAREHQAPAIIGVRPALAKPICPRPAAGVQSVNGVRPETQTAGAGYLSQRDRERRETERRNNRAFFSSCLLVFLCLSLFLCGSVSKRALDSSHVYHWATESQPQPAADGLTVRLAAAQKKQQARRGGPNLLQYYPAPGENAGHEHTSTPKRAYQPLCTNWAYFGGTVHGPVASHLANSCEMGTSRLRVRICRRQNVAMAPAGVIRPSRTARAAS